jgi:hypothetical protein
MAVSTQWKFRAAVGLAAVIWSGSAGSLTLAAQDEANPPETCPLCRDYEKGCPQSIAGYAQPSNTPRYIGYYVGGGAAFKGEPRFVDEGTWGWDYSGGLFHRRVWLSWWHGQRTQGGTGSYRTDGPRLLQPH